VARARLDPAGPFGRHPLKPHQLLDRVTRTEDTIVLCQTHYCWLRLANIPRAQGRHGTTHPRAVPSAVRDWLGADH
jgi:hypothetical protein